MANSPSIQYRFSLVVQNSFCGASLDRFLGLALVTWNLPKFPKFLSSSVPLPPGMGSAEEQLSLASSPLVLNMPHDNTMLLWHMSSMGPETQVVIKHERMGHLDMSVTQFLFFC